MHCLPVLERLREGEDRRGEAPQLAGARLPAAASGHLARFASSLLDSQLGTLEPLGPDERHLEAGIAPAPTS